MSNSAVRRESSLKHVSGELPVKADIDTTKPVGKQSRVHQAGKPEADGRSISV